MALQDLIGAGLWLPTLHGGLLSTGVFVTTDSALLDADEEEAQFIGTVRIDGGGSKTFGTSGSKIGWLSGPSITFASGSTLRIGVKKSSSFGFGVPSRATIGQAAFDVYDDQIGGTDTIASTTWRDETMSAGTPFTVNNGDSLAVCFHLDITSGTPSVKIRCASSGVTAMGYPAVTLVTSGPTYTSQTSIPNIVLTFDDGTLGWIVPTVPFNAIDTSSATIGSGNIFANIFRIPFQCKVDAMAAVLNPTAGGSDFALELYSTPLGTPSLIESIPFTAGQMATISNNRLFFKPFTSVRTLIDNTDYAIGVKQSTATAVNTVQRDISNANYFKPLGMGAECYGATSTGGATFASVNSGRRRYHVWIRVSSLSDTVSGGGMLPSPAMNGGLV